MLCYFHCVGCKTSAALRIDDDVRLWLAAAGFQAAHQLVSDEIWIHHHAEHHWNCERANQSCGVDIKIHHCPGALYAFGLIVPDTLSLTEKELAWNQAIDELEWFMEGNYVVDRLLIPIQREKERRK